MIDRYERGAMRLGVMAMVMLAASISVAAGAPQAQATSGWREAVREFARTHFRNPAWGYSHCQRDYALARRLAAADHVTLDDDVLFAASFLHDMAAFAPWENEGLDHSDVAADVVGKELARMGFPMAKLEPVREAIRDHMYYRQPQGPEAIYLHDADALDWLGAIGVARVVALTDPNGGDPDGPKSIRFLEDNLAKAPGSVVSAAGKALVPARRAEVERFLEELRAETEDLRAL